MKHCMLCPRRCGADRTASAGQCGAQDNLKAARAAAHMGEEPCISGKNGSGAVFFSHCPLGCIYCQNEKISTGGFGKEITPQTLADIFLALAAEGVHNIDLVTPTHFAPLVLRALDRVRHRLSIPIIMNSGGYERPETLRLFDGYVDVYLPDFKYMSPELARRYSHAPDYAFWAEQAVVEMQRQTGPPQKDGGGLLVKGTLVRHLVLPGAWHDSVAVLDRLTEILPKDSFLLSLMRQYTPMPTCREYPEINRPLTSLEYRKVAEHAVRLGLSGYAQERGAAGRGYIPDFNLQGVTGD